MSCERTSLKFALWPELVASFQPVLSSLFDYFVPVSCCPTITFEFQSFSNVSMHYVVFLELRVHPCHQKVCFAHG